MNRRKFVTQTTLAGAGILFAIRSSALPEKYPTVRVPVNKRKFTSTAVEDLIKEITSSIGNKEVAWLFENCFPNTLDTTVDHTRAPRPDTYVITGDIDAMWLRDSSAQVFPYLPLCKKDEPLRLLIQGVINRQAQCIIKDPYANAFYKDDTRWSEWRKDVTDMKPGIHERKWEIDSLCYPIRLSYHYWKETGDKTPFDATWIHAMETVVTTFGVQQRMHDRGPYSFMRETQFGTDTVPLGGYGYPVKPNGLICSMFRPSDDATIFPYLIPSNIFALESLEQLSEMAATVAPGNSVLTGRIHDMMVQIREGLKQAVTALPGHETIYAFEINGMGSYNLMDDANVPSLLSLSYLVPKMAKDPIYRSTRKFCLSQDNPFFFKGVAGEGVGGPHAGMNRIWPLSIIMRALTSDSDTEISECIGQLCKTHAGTGFMHESFNKDNASDFTRPWFAWANTLFGELIWKTYRERPHLLR
jgi:uncharacterized protein